MTEFKVRKDTTTNKLATAIVSNMKNMKQLELSCLGAGTVNQCIKSFITAKAMAVQIGMTLHIDPIYRNVMIEKDNKEKTLIVFIVTKEED